MPPPNGTTVPGSRPRLRTPRAPHAPAPVGRPAGVSSCQSAPPRPAPEPDTRKTQRTCPNLKRNRSLSHRGRAAQLPRSAGLALSTAWTPSVNLVDEAWIARLHLGVQPPTTMTPAWVRSGWLGRCAIRSLRRLSRRRLGRPGGRAVAIEALQVRPRSRFYRGGRPSELLPAIVVVRLHGVNVASSVDGDTPGTPGSS